MTIPPADSAVEGSHYPAMFQANVGAGPVPARLSGRASVIFLRRGGCPVGQTGNREIGKSEDRKIGKSENRAGTGPAPTFRGYPLIMLIREG